MNFFIFNLLINLGAAAEYSVESTTCPNTKIIHAERTFLRKRGTNRHLGRILGGVITPIEEAPYMAAILEDTFFLCGASILSTVFIITAAHCIAEVEDIYSLMIRIGSSYYGREGQTRGVIYWAMHPDFNEETFEYDCAVLRVDEAFKKTGPYRELQLPFYNPRKGEKLLASGWGFSGRHVTRARLKSVNITVLDRKLCVEYYAKRNFSMPLSAFCGGNLEGGRDTCTGDSGGPTVRNHTEIAGIISLGYRCGRPGVPGVYTNVFFIVDWIYTKIHNPLWLDY